MSSDKVSFSLITRKLGCVGESMVRTCQDCGRGVVTGVLVREVSK